MIKSDVIPIKRIQELANSSFQNKTIYNSMRDISTTTFRGRVLHFENLRDILKKNIAVNSK